MIIPNDADFIFLYEAIQCNPNGDPDQENKPRMDYDTRTNLVTDVRIKRYIRDFLKQEGKEIFVDMVSDAKVNMEQRLGSILQSIMSDEQRMQQIINNDEVWSKYKSIKEQYGEKAIDQLISEKPADRDVNRAILSGLVRLEYIDVRLFGSAFAVKGFTNAMTGPVQMNWGYSINRVYLLDSDTISSIMSDDSSTFGKDYRVKYSLIGFHGSINRAAAKTTGLTQEDLDTFRSALWNSLSASPTRSKLNQYPKLYLEITYNQGYYNGHFGDLRQYISAQPIDGLTDREVRSMSDLVLDLSQLTSLLKENKGEDRAIKNFHLRYSSELAKFFPDENT